MLYLKLLIKGAEPKLLYLYLFALCVFVFVIVSWEKLGQRVLSAVFKGC